MKNEVVRIRQYKGCVAFVNIKDADRYAEVRKYFLDNHGGEIDQYVFQFPSFLYNEIIENPDKFGPLKEGEVVHVVRFTDAGVDLRGIVKPRE